MRGLDVFIVRFIPFLLFLIVGWNIEMATEGRISQDFNLLHSNSAIYALALFFISLSNKRYHCVYNRAMYVLLVLLPIFNYLDARYIHLRDVDVVGYILIVKIMYYATALITCWLAIRHFIRARKKRNE
jgi:hypothetical protein